jgi:hypothetical protein
MEEDQEGLKLVMFRVVQREIVRALLAVFKHCYNPSTSPLRQYSSHLKRLIDDTERILSITARLIGP